MAKTSVAPKPQFFPEVFRYEAFNGHAEGGLETVLHALEKLSRLSQRGFHACDALVGDAELLDELAVAVECAAGHAREMHGKAGA